MTIQNEEGIQTTRDCKEINMVLDFENNCINDT